MKVIKTEIPDLLIIEPNVHEDERGYFFESYNQNNYREQGLDHTFVQDNESKSSFGVLRGLHYQLDPFAQVKLIRVLKGEIMDIAVDIRKNSPTFGKWLGMRLSEDNRKQLLIPGGFAHGFSVLSKTAVVFYKCDSFYNPEAERGIIFNDPFLAIDWGLDTDEAIISDKDRSHPLFKEAEMNFHYRNGSIDFPI
ncbi:MAG: dTDP-4-dehydrorhamnose 3,5-epimerase [Bacteroidales bacterium]|nr:MAG: dTDP-4-dehydrorhamnose 3,5-epimerase [Bacteroidales bacterium]